MDAVDLAILQELTSHEAILFAGLNPRLSPEVVSRRLGLDPSTIRARIRHWEEHGFLLGFHVLPHPGLLGLRHFVGYATVPAPEDRPVFFEALALVDGVVTSLDHVHGSVGVGLYVADEVEARRKMDLVAKLPGVTETITPFQPFPQAAHAPPSPLEWRVLSAVREDPRGRLPDLAAKVGVSANTFGARFSQLAERGALWSVASLDFTRFVGGVFVRSFVEIDERTDLPRVAESVQLAVRPKAFLRPAGAPGKGRRRVHVMLVLDSIAEVEDFERVVRATEGVLGVRTLFPRRYRVHVAWIGGLVDAAAAARARA